MVKSTLACLKVAKLGLKFAVTQTCFDQLLSQKQITSDPRPYEVTFSITILWLTRLSISTHLRSLTNRLSVFCRRAHSRKQLDKAEDAVGDLKRILDLQPRNSAALQDLREWTGDADLKAGTVNSLFQLVDPTKLGASETGQDEMTRIQISEVYRSKLTKGKPTPTVAPSGDASKRPTMPLVSDASSRSEYACFTVKGVMYR